MIEEGDRMLEGEKVEFKREYTENIKKAVIAFANTEGGSIYIGIEDDSSVIGIDDADDVQKRVISLCKDGIQPDIMMFLSCDTIMIEEKTVLRVQVQRGTARPYYLRGKGVRPEGVFVRRGSVSIPASYGQILKMIRESGNYHYEQERSMEQELTFKEAEGIFTEAGITFGDSQKRSLGIISRDGLYTNLGLLLSDQCTHTVKAAIFSGGSHEVFRNRREFSGSLLGQVGQLVEYLDFYNELRSEIRGMKRIDSRSYPPESVREVIFNAAVHRDYAFSGSTLVKLYDDRLEVLSLGGLTEGITYDDMMLGASIQRNPKLAEVFFRLHYIEAFGTGVQRIFSDYEKAETKPKFLVSDNAFKVILPNLNYGLKVEHVSAVREQVDRYLQSDGLSDLERVRRAIASGMSSRRELQDEMGFSLTKMINILRQLLDEGAIARSGQGKNTRYHVK